MLLLDHIRQRKNNWFQFSSVQAAITAETNLEHPIYEHNTVSGI